ncbi:MAG: DUF4920 domain-containing protein [Acidobacteriota bacterium]
MRSIISLAILISALSISALAQMGDMEPTEKDKTEAIPASGVLKRGAPIGKAAKASLAKILATPGNYDGKTVLVDGVIVRSCTMEGCWAELAAEKDGASIHVDMKDHSFFIPLKSAGSLARAEGTVSVKTLSKAQVDHMIDEDGAKFDKRNADGSVTQISFEATGIELRKES